MGVTSEQRLCKQPSEKRNFCMEFGNLLDISNSEIVSAINSISSNYVGGATSDLTISNSGISDGLGTSSQVCMWIQDGTSGKQYRIEVIVTTSAGQILEGDGILNVTDR